jgi:hypothetical protein
MRFSFVLPITGEFGVLGRSASRHQVVHKRRLPLRIDFRIGQSP